MHVTGDSAASMATTSATSEAMAVANKSQNSNKSKLLPTVDIQDCSSQNHAVILEVDGRFEDDELADLTSKNVMKSPTVLTPPQCTPRSTSPISKSPATRSPARSPVRSPTSSKNPHHSSTQKQFLQGMSKIRFGNSRHF